jgi:DNA-binding transcriptional regulator LsrR (DeoR family)
MRVPEHPTLIRRMLDARLGQLSSHKPILAASLVQISKHCGRKACHCQQGGPLHTAWHLTYKVKGKTRTVYVPLDLLDEVRSWIEEHKRIKAVLAEVHELTVALVRTHAAHTKPKQDRP